MLNKRLFIDYIHLTVWGVFCLTYTTVSWDFRACVPVPFGMWKCYASFPLVVFFCVGNEKRLPDPTRPDPTLHQVSPTKCILTRISKIGEREKGLAALAFSVPKIKIYLIRKLDKLAVLNNDSAMWLLGNMTQVWICSLRGVRKCNASPGGSVLQFVARFTFDKLNALRTRWEFVSDLQSFKD